MGFGMIDAAGRTLDVGGNDGARELTLYSDSQAYAAADGHKVRIYLRGNGIQVGCTHVSRQAFEKIAALFEKE